MPSTELTLRFWVAIVIVINGLCSDVISGKLTEIRVTQEVGHTVTS